MTNQCHDITVYPEIGLAAGACSGNGILMDISDPVNPKRLDHVVDKNFAYWHSATFNNDGTKVIFTDEWGGGARPRCRATDLPTWGADAIFDIVDKKLQFKGYYKMPAPQTDQENCVAHNGSLIPVPGRDIMVQAWYQGGVSVFDFTDSANPVEIAFFDRGPIDAEATWSPAATGRPTGTTATSTAPRSRAASTSSACCRASTCRRTRSTRRCWCGCEEFNSQQQPKVTWPAIGGRGARLSRSAEAQQGDRRTPGPSAISSTLDRADRIRSSDRGAAPAAAELVTLAGELERDAATATGRDQSRMRAMAETLKGRAAQLR